MGGTHQSRFGLLGADYVPTLSFFSAIPRGFLLTLIGFQEGEGKEWRRRYSQDEQRVRGAFVAVSLKAECFHSIIHHPLIQALIHSANMYQVPLGWAGAILGSSDMVVNKTSAWLHGTYNLGRETDNE